MVIMKAIALLLMLISFISKLLSFACHAWRGHLIKTIHSAFFSPAIRHRRKPGFIGAKTAAAFHGAVVEADALLPVRSVSRRSNITIFCVIEDVSRKTARESNAAPLPYLSLASPPFIMHPRLCGCGRHILLIVHARS
jgi:hypothetical protein